MSEAFILHLWDWTLRSAAVGALTGCVTLGVRNAAWRHALWTMVLASLFLMPLGNLVLPAATLPPAINRMTAERGHALPGFVSMESSVAVAKPALARNTQTFRPIASISFPGIASVLIIAVALALLIRLALAYRHLAGLRRASRAISPDALDAGAFVRGLAWRSTSVRESDHVHVPLTIGFFRPVIFLPADWRQWVDSKLRNIERFPRDFMFRLNRAETTNLRSQFVTASLWGGRRNPPYAFTEQGVAMLSSVLRSPRAVLVNIAIMRAFVHLRQMLQGNTELARKLAALEKKYDAQFRVVFDAIRELMEPPRNPKRKIGFSGSTS